ncbi:bsu-protein phosphatase [Tritrichomonas foetus]|uniref:protein-serine/threonine phosphatase n=1 Tax=Tritrichomonas foetus TaxID=1144522 RepID=A0A1J4KYC2_9EUKA|nr:bsu-protein phosphatase [Tritrichomonas foetus]|eukprot:OHT14557.1 bsu-protein phosphatase [Tritrichomonas foetus]
MFSKNRNIVSETKKKKRKEKKQVMNQQHSAPAFPCRSPSNSIFAEYYNPILALPATDIEKVGDTIPIPIFAKQQLVALCKRTLALFRIQGPVVYVQGDAVVVSGLHGDFHKLLRIFTKYGRPPNTNYVFVGDFIDGGSYSLEVVELLFTLAISYPQNVFLLRGKSEFFNLNKSGGFQDEIFLTYRSPLIYEEFLIPFAFLPVAAVIGGDSSKIFVSYGCVSDTIPDLEDLSAIEIPFEPNSQIGLKLYWGNTNPKTPSDDSQNNYEDIGFLPDEGKVSEFLTANEHQFLMCSTGQKGEIIPFCNGKAASINGMVIQTNTTGNLENIFSVCEIDNTLSPIPRKNAKFNNITPQFDPFNQKGVGTLRGVQTQKSGRKYDGGNSTFIINSSVSLMKMPTVPTTSNQSLAAILSQKVEHHTKNE